MLRQDIVPSDTRGLEEANYRFRSEADLCGALFNVRGGPIADLPAASILHSLAPGNAKRLSCVVQSATVFVGVRRAATESWGMPHYQHQLSTKMPSLAHAVRRSRFRERKARHRWDTYDPRLEQRN